MAEPLPSRELRQLLDTALDRARTALDDEGAFFPFALAIESSRAVDDDEIAVLEASADDDEHGEPVEIDEEEAVEALLAALQETGEDFRAVAIAFDSVVDEEWDGVTVLLAHRDGLPVDAVLPYRIAGARRVYAEVERNPGTLEVWS
ncbi:MAG: hypothetical protein QM635_07900 [Microbacteriaceae bacterium]